MTPELWSKLGRAVRELFTPPKHSEHPGGKHGCGCGCGAGHGHGHAHLHTLGCCPIPETCCPPRCPDAIGWKIHRGAVPEATIDVRNVGDYARTFTFTATPLSGVGAGSAQLVVAPAAQLLAPGQSTTVHVKLTDSAALRACQRYRAEILIKGAWEQCVEVELDVVADAFDKVDVEQSGSHKDSLLHAGAVKSAIDWKIERGVVPEGVITLHNRGQATQSFAFEPGALVGPSPGGAMVVATPSTLLLGAGQSGVVRLTLQDSQDLSPGQPYLGEVIVRGYYDQRVGIRSFALPDPSDRAEVEQGNPPTRIRAHHWYDHFQCTESCLPGAHAPNVTA